MYIWIPWFLNLVAGHGSLFSYDFVSHSGKESHLDFEDISLTLFEGVFNHSTTLTRAYFSALIYYLVPLELDHVDHTTTTTFVKIKVAKEDLTTLKCREYGHISMLMAIYFSFYQEDWVSQYNLDLHIRL